jgi:hypothetical protein
MIQFRVVSAYIEIKREKWQKDEWKIENRNGLGGGGGGGGV